MDDAHSYRQKMLKEINNLIKTTSADIRYQKDFHEANKFVRHGMYKYCEPPQTIPSTDDEV